MKITDEFFTNIIAGMCRERVMIANVFERARNFDYLGALQSYARKLGTSVDSLSDGDKSQAIMDALLGRESESW